MVFNIVFLLSGPSNLDTHVFGRLLCAVKRAWTTGLFEIDLVVKIRCVMEKRLGKSRVTTLADSMFERLNRFITNQGV